MYDIFFYALLFLFIPLGIFFLFSWVILYHILKYGFIKSTNKKIAFVYAFVMIALVLFLVQNFFSVNWDRASLTDFLYKSNINIFIGTYGR